MYVQIHTGEGSNYGKEGNFDKGRILLEGRIGR